jgi:ribulose bisphosphate carboxylase small subunit
MTKTEKKQEVTRMFYEFIESKRFEAHDEGHGYWYVYPKNNQFSTTMFQVTRDFEINTFGCESEHVLEFADILKEKLNEYVRMFNL